MVWSDGLNHRRVRVRPSEPTSADAARAPHNWRGLASRAQRRGRCGDGIAVLDLVEDRVSHRLTGVVFVFCLFLLMSHQFIRAAVPSPAPQVETISFASDLPASATIAAALPRAPSLVLSGADHAPVRGDPLTVEVVSVHHTSEPFRTLNCGTEHRRRERHTMSWSNEAVACKVILEVAHSYSDDKGRVALDGLRVQHGPPARYTLRFKSDNVIERQKEISLQVRARAPACAGRAHQYMYIHIYVYIYITPSLVPFRL